MVIIKTKPVKLDLNQAAEAIRNKAFEEGFETFGITHPKLGTREQNRLRDFISKGEHGTMQWMEKNLERRLSPKHLWEETRAIIMLGINYAGAANISPRAASRQPAGGAIMNERTLTTKGMLSVYARNLDYHDVIKKKQRKLARFIVDHYGGEVKIFVDTAPVAEKPLAQQAGIGWVGKHTNLVAREFGSWMFLGAIFTNLPLPPSQSMGDLCGSCQRCLDVCPTKAFPKPYQLDARKCISYLTIEYKGIIPRQFRKAIGNRIYGCDDCLAVCPWNKFARQSNEIGFHPRKDIEAPLIADLLKLDDAAFRHLFRKSPVKRIGHSCFIRNVLIAAGNSKDRHLIKAIYPYLQSPSELLRASAIWAIAEISLQEARMLKKRYQSAETNPKVLAEWVAL